MELDFIKKSRRFQELKKNVFRYFSPCVQRDNNKLKDGQSETNRKPVLRPQSRDEDLIDPEEFSKLQEKYELKVRETTLLRAELAISRKESQHSLDRSKKAEAKVFELKERLNLAEAEKHQVKSLKDLTLDLETDLKIARQKYIKVSKDYEGIKSELSDLKLQSDYYSNKYLEAQQTVEKLKTQLSKISLEAAKNQGQFIIKIMQIRAQFQSKIEVLAQFPDMLKKIQTNLGDAVKVNALERKKGLILTKYLEDAKNEEKKLKKSLDEITTEKTSLQKNIHEIKKELEETRIENLKLRDKNNRLEEQPLAYERLYEEKVKEVLQLHSQLQKLKVDSAQQIFSAMEYWQNEKNNLEMQIRELEDGVRAASAEAELTKQDRDLQEIMKDQIMHLNFNYEEAQIRILNLQSQVNHLKNCFTKLLLPVDVFSTNENSLGKTLGYHMYK